jgi:hypothetical protein
LRFFFDNCLAPRLARALNALCEGEHEVIPLRDKFDPATKDTEWIRALAHEGDWVIVSGDTRITRNPGEKAAWQESRLTAFFLAKGWQNAHLWDVAHGLVRWWPTIVQQAKAIEPGAGFEVPFRAKQLKLAIIPIKKK